MGVLVASPVAIQTPSRLEAAPDIAHIDRFVVQCLSEPAAGAE